MEELKYYTLKEVCAILKISQPRLYEYMNKGELEYDTVGSRRRITPQQIKAYTERKKEQK